MSKIRVGILRGGTNDLFPISMRTGAFVIGALNSKKYEPIDIVVSKGGEWIIDGHVRLPEYVLHTVDVVFNGLHGSYGEDGTVQRLFERYGVPYTGSSPFSSLISLNKALAKDMLKEQGIKMPQHVTVSSESLPHLGKVVENITRTFGPEYIIKPVTSGASTGTMIVKNPLLLPQALHDALSSFDEVMVEARIVGREATCGIINNFRDEPLYALPVVEVVLPVRSSFLDKATKEGTRVEYLCPARFDASTKKEIEETARRVHSTLNLSQYSRSDFIVADDGIYFLETNALPQLDLKSPFMNSLKAIGARNSDFLDHLVTEALVRY